mgnify:CR=1 FL=1
MTILTSEDRLVDYDKIDKMRKDNNISNEEYRALREKARKIIMKYYDHLDYMGVSISLAYMVDFHGIDALKGIIGVENWTNENIEDYPDTAMGCIGHDLPMPDDLRHDILPKCMNYIEYC